MTNPDRVCLSRRNNVDWIDSFLLNDYNQATNIRTPHELAGSKAKMELVGESSQHPILVLSSTTGGIILPTQGNDLMVHVPAATMWQLAAGVYDADCLLFAPNGAVTLAFILQLEVIQGDTPPSLP